MFEVAFTTVVNAIFLKCKENHTQLKVAFTTGDGRCGHLVFKQVWPACEHCKRSIRAAQMVKNVFQ